MLIFRKRHKIATYFQWKSNRKSYVVYRMAPVLVTLNGLECHSPVAGLFKCNPSNICAVFYQISTDSTSRGPSATARLLVFTVQCYASVVYAAAVCLCVSGCLCVYVTSRCSTKMTQWIELIFDMQTSFQFHLSYTVL